MICVSAVCVGVGDVWVGSVGMGMWEVGVEVGVIQIRIRVWDGRHGAGREWALGWG